MHNYMLPVNKKVGIPGFRTNRYADQFALFPENRYEQYENKHQDNERTRIIGQYCAGDAVTLMTGRDMKKLQVKKNIYTLYLHYNSTTIRVLCRTKSPSRSQGNYTKLCRR